MPVTSEHPVGAAYAGILLFIVGIAIGGWTLEINWREAEQFQDWPRADGTVTAVFGAGSATRALVSFSTPSGDRVNFTTQPNLRSRFAPGDMVPVLYSPVKSTDALVDPRPARRTRNLLAGTGSLIVMALGAYVAWYARRWDSRG
jgi:hypothetical protein